MNEFELLRGPLAGALSILCLLTACSDEGEDDGTGGSSSGQTTSGSTSSVGGAGQGGEGGQGGQAPTCLPASASAPYFTIGDASLCAVARYEAADLTLDSYGKVPSWGRHGGPLTYEATPTLATLERFSLQGGSLARSAEDLTLVGLPGDAFFGGPAVDVVSDTRTLFGWTGQDFFNVGGLVVAENGSTTHLAVTGLFGLLSVGGRVFHSGFSALGGAAAGTGVYAADTSALSLGSLLSAWGLATGPIGADQAGNVFAIMTDYTTNTQELRGFLAADVAPGGGATPGTILATLPGFGDALAVLGDSTGGRVFLQPNDATTFENIDVVSVAYTIDQGTLSGSAAASFLTLAQADTNLTLMTDDQGRLWVGTNNAEGAAGAVFFVVTDAN